MARFDHARYRALPLMAVLVALIAVPAVRYARNGRPARPVAARPAAPLAVPPAIGPEARHPGEEARGPQVWALVVGIDGYLSVTPCHGAVRDARAVRRWLVETAGWGADHVLLMDDEGRADPGDPAGPSALGLRPTRRNLDWAVRSWLLPRARDDDVVVIYFAGHAVALPPSRRAASRRRWSEWALPIDANPSDFEATAWSIEEAVGTISGGRRRSIVCWLDTSPQGRGEPVLRGGGDPPSGARWLSKLVRWPGVTAWLASDGKPSVEGADGGNSPFTAALLDSLGSRAEALDLLACLDRLRLDDRLAGRGFRSRGGVAPGLTLWSEKIRSRVARKPELLLQRGHADRVTSVAFAPDGKRLISASMDATVKLWDVGESSMTLVRDLPHRMDRVTCMALGPTRRWIVAGDASGRLHFLGLDDLLEARSRPVHEASIVSIAPLPDGLHVVSLDRRGNSWWWDVDDPARVAPLVADASDLACATRPGARVAVAVAHKDGKVSLFDAGRRLVGTVDGPEGRLEGLALSADGRLLALGDDLGRVAVHRLGGDGGGEAARLVAFSGRIHRLAFSPSGLLAVAAGESLSLVDPSGTGSGPPLATGGRVEQVAFSPDGKGLACCTAIGGRVTVWDLADPGAPRPISPANPEGAGSWAGVLCLSYSPDGSRLVAGGGDGSIRSWNVERGGAWDEFPPHRGQVTGLSVSPDGRYLLQVTRDMAALVWDLEEGRTLTRVAGEWTSGAILPDGSGYAMTSRAGEALVVDRDGRNRRTLARPGSPDGGPLEAALSGIRISPDGRWIAATTLGDHACLWDRETGRPTLVEGHEDRVTSLDFSADSRHLFTASEDGTVWRRPLAGGTPPLVHSVPDDVEGPRAVTAVSACPADSRRVAAGTRDGHIFLWDGDRPADPPLVAEFSAREVRALTFSADGRRLAASGPGLMIGLWEIRERAMVPMALEPRPNHSSSVDALAAWPGGRVLASGGADTAVRLWDLDRRELLGTLAADQGGDRWVIFTPPPEGLFDASRGGEHQVTWLVDGEVRPLEQFYETHHVLGLGDDLRHARRPPVPRPRPLPPPMIWIEPPAEPGPAARVVELEVRSAEPDLTDVRLYQDDVAVRSGPDLERTPDPRLLRARVTLHAGENRFYAMAGRHRSIDGRSDDVVLRYEGETPGRLHVLALGISGYRDRPLRFADADARRVASYLHGHGFGDPDEPGLERVLTNDDVTPEKVALAFRQLRERARPEDTVVLFLAGHTDVFDGQFHLLLPKFPFPDRGRPLVARRGGEATPGAPGPVPGETLPYATLYGELARVDALKRLVIVDACHSGAVYDDRAVRLIQETLEGGARPARTSYILAARRDDPANEVEALRHGLLSYVLLRGMGERQLEPVPDPAAFSGLRDADLDHDRRVTTGELREYAALVLPRLTSQFPELTQRAGGGPGPFPSQPSPGGEPSLRTNTASFPLVELSRDEDGSPRAP